MARFSLYTTLLLNVEGGYQAHTQDSGNYNSLNQLVGTNYGISAPVYETWIGRVPTVNDMKSITKSTALKIYKILYWDKCKGALMINQSVADIIVDHAVNAGVYAASKLTQRVLNSSFSFKLVVDGVIGNNTIQAINSVNQLELHNEIYKAREAHYINIGGVFYTGWLYRLKKFVFTEKKKIVIGLGITSVIVLVATIALIRKLNN